MSNLQNKFKKILKQIDLYITKDKYLNLDRKIWFIIKIIKETKKVFRKIIYYKYYNI